MAEVILKTIRNSKKYGQLVKTTSFEIVGNPPHVFAFKKIKKK
jgi:hypothetical protein